MAQGKRDAVDRRVVQIAHRGQWFTVRLISPSVSADGRDIHPEERVIREAEIIRDRAVIVRGWLIPSRFEVLGRDGLYVTFTLEASDPLGSMPIVVSSLEVRQVRRVERSERSARALGLVEWSFADLPPLERLRDAALQIASVWVRLLVPSGSPRISTDMSPEELRDAHEEWRRWDETASLEVLGLADSFTRSDRDLLTGKTPRDLPPFDSAQALREVARLYEEAYRDGARPNAPIIHYIATRTFRATGTVRRQIAEARKRGFIVEAQPPRRASKTQRRQRK